MSYYEPPVFSLWDFDSVELSKPQGRRWLVHFDGLVGQPAKEVVLGWAGSGATALVCSSGEPYDDAAARARAAHIALGGRALPVSGRPISADQATAEINRLTADIGLWRPVTDRDLVAIDAHGFRAGYRLLSDGALFIAATGLARTDDLSLKRVRSWDDYDVNASTALSLADLQHV